MLACINIALRLRQPPQWELFIPIQFSKTVEIDSRESEPLSVVPIRGLPLFIPNYRPSLRPRPAAVRITNIHTHNKLPLESFSTASVKSLKVTHVLQLFLVPLIHPLPASHLSLQLGLNTRFAILPIPFIPSEISTTLPASKTTFLTHPAIFSSVFPP
ncbi:uncharacterized protein EI90DRAFT_2109531 [Cantharellus anzutake]|uniref:uncharacterized protein n=1 Tax=Cantharellus anzutake TaxID=1750568 RepID=UPI001908421B|nr:uncharacterized protein EI90DRAFT_2109531 [Cantharellus anzutake]KAF8325639.1 hypothetical protein EI90DRAFT_2109531 [Cantharellus anzutake]